MSIKKPLNRLIRLVDLQCKQVELVCFHNSNISFLFLTGLCFHRRMNRMFLMKIPLSPPFGWRPSSRCEFQTCLARNILVRWRQPCFLQYQDRPNWFDWRYWLGLRARSSTCLRHVQCHGCNRVQHPTTLVLRRSLKIVLWLNAENVP